MTEANKTRALQALLDDGNKTLTQAAEAANISRRTLYGYLTDKGFIAEYQKQAAVKAVDRAAAMQTHFENAIATLANIMNNEEIPAAVRISAAKAIITANNECQQTALERLAAVEMLGSFGN